MEEAINEAIMLASAFSSDTIGKPEHHMVSGLYQMLTEIRDGKFKPGMWKVLYSGVWTAIEMDRQTK